MAAHTGRPYWVTGMAMTMPAKPIIEPSERSNSPAIIRRQAPMAMMPSWADTSSQLRMPLAENMPVSPATVPKNRKTRSVPARAPSSGRPKARLSRPSRRSRSSERGGAGSATAGAPSVGRLVMPFPWRGRYRTVPANFSTMPMLSLVT